MDDAALEKSLETYREQLSQVQNALQAAGEENNGDLVQLRGDLEQVIQLTEEGLLSMKKSKLLSMLESGNHGAQTAQAASSSSDHRPTEPDLDAEFAAFQAAVADDTSEPSPKATAVPPGGHPVRSPPQLDAHPASSAVDDAEAALQEIAGTKCRAPFHHSWGEWRYHNAMILSAEPLQEECEPKVRVLYCNPTHQSMVACSFFMEGHCRFTDDECRYCHGEVIPVQQLEEYEDVDYSKLVLESKCLAKDADNIWYKAMVVDLLDSHRYKVMYDSNYQTATVDLQDIVPLGHDCDAEEDSCEEDEDEDEDAEERTLQPVSGSESDDENALPVFLWRPSQTTAAFGDWEAHTKGIASKLMAQMGYVVGQGLGRTGEGRTEPVPIQLLPQGKSLDKIMELKEKAGDQDLYDVMKRQRRKQKSVDKKATAGYKKTERSTVFDFLNKKLRGKKGNLKQLVKQTASKDGQPSNTVTHISERDLKDRSDKHMNIQLLKTSEEIRNTRREISGLRTSLSRNQQRGEKTVVDRIGAKITSLENYILQLQSSEQTMQKQKKARSDHKKLTVF